MRRRTLIIGLGAAALARPSFAQIPVIIVKTPPSPADARPWKTDEYGRQYRDETRFGKFEIDGKQFPAAKFREYKQTVKTKPAAGEPPHEMNTVVTDPVPRPATDQTGEVTTPQDADAAAAKVKANDPDVSIEDYGYSFGRAGVPAVGAALAYGVGASLAGLPDQAERIKQMEGDLEAMRASLAAQSAAAADRLAGMREALQARGASIEAAVSEPSPLPPGAFEDVLRISDQGFLFATPDAVLATRLQRVGTAVDRFDPAAVPGPVKDLVRASIRQSDAESAIGNETSAREMYALAGNLTEAALGFVPVIGAVQSAYELATGYSMITGRALSGPERAFAAVNIVLLGEFGTVEHGLEALAKLGSIVGGARGVAMGKAAAEVLLHWPTKMINRVLSWRAAGKAVIAEERIGLAASRSLVPVSAVDGVYARVMERKYAEALAQGGRLGGDSVTFITAGEDIRGLTSWSDIAKKLTLLQENGALRAFNGEVVVEFKFVNDEPLAYLARPFGEYGKYGPGWLPTGFTVGSAREWVIDSEAIGKGLIDVKSLRIRPITQ